MALLIRRGPTADRVGKVFAEGELIYDTTNGQVYVGDGTTEGGVSITTYTDGQATDAAGALLDAATGNVAFTYDANTNALTANVTLDGVGIMSVEDDTSPQLGGYLDLNGKNITGTGDINITGDVTATGFYGNVTGDLNGNANTATNGVVTTGSYADPLWITSIAGSKVTGNISGNAGTVTNGVYTSGDQTIGGIKTFSSNIVGNITGSIYEDGNNIPIVDATTNAITVDTLTVNTELVVNGTTTTINTTSLEVTDKNIIIANVDTPTDTTANGGGITIKGADDKTLTYSSTGDKFVFNKRVDATSFYGDLTGAVTGDVQGNLTGDVTGDVQGNLTGNVITENISAPGSNPISVVDNIEFFQAVDVTGLATLEDTTINGVTTINTVPANPVAITVNDSTQSISTADAVNLKVLTLDNVVGSGPALNFQAQILNSADTYFVGAIQAISDGDGGGQMKIVVADTNPLLGGTIDAVVASNGSLTTNVPLFATQGLIVTKRTIVHSTGTADDIAGMVAIDDGYIYFCKADYDGTTNIWVRTPHGLTTW